MSCTASDFTTHIGIEPLWTAIRAIDRHNVEGVTLILPDGRRLSVDDRDEIEALAPDAQIDRIVVHGIAWDGTDWEYAEEVPAGDWDALDTARQNFEDALDEHNAFEESENWD